MNVEMQFYLNGEPKGGELLHALRFNHDSSWENALDRLISKRHPGCKLQEVMITETSDNAWIEVTSPLVLAAYNATPIIRVYLQCG